MTQLFGAVLLIFVAQTSFAQTYYEELRQIYKESATPISLEDIDVVGDPDAKVCVEVKAEDQNTANLAHVRKFKVVRDGRGPLLPRKEFVRVIFSEVVQPDLRSMFPLVETTLNPTEIVSVHNLSQKFELRVRKNADGYINFQKTVYLEKRKTQLSYGYCYSSITEE